MASSNLPQPLGQYWLRDKASLDAVVGEAGLTKSDTVLEIGPGQGDLTNQLVKFAGKVIAVEFDKSLIPKLEDKIKANNLEIINSDILSFDLSVLTKDYKVVANIPYYLTSKLLRLISESTNPPSLAILLVQKEVAQRVCAKPGKMSLLSVATQFYFNCNLGQIITADKFTPNSKVDSQVVILIRRKKPLYESVKEDEYFRIVRAGFSSRRKTVLNSLSAGLRLNRQETEQIIIGVGLDPNLRPQKLSLDDWHKLYKVIHK
ncbi:MAG TPA: 16S rRNA (adenine(1518)-N(6)/adenine(1519)-N(6))-dimethyltransferase RsmA [Candidatus Saccharimonadales bacterium]|nr:16S rRNA (adenine(1518)-N(6)/adenine(1519)-N(6))-dimethyltransferase RsmA [Candidatus Saccharimonadales bacterium]